MTQASTDPWTVISVRESTKRKLDQIAKDKRWQLYVAADEAFNSFAKAEGIDLSNATPAPSN